MRLPESSGVLSLSWKTTDGGNPLQKEVCALSVAGGKNAPLHRGEKRIHSYGYSRSLALRSLLAPRRSGRKRMAENRGCEGKIAKNP